VFKEEEEEEETTYAASSWATSYLSISQRRTWLYNSVM